MLALGSAVPFVSQHPAGTADSSMYTTTKKTDSPVRSTHAAIAAAFSPQGNARRGVDVHGHVAHVMTERYSSNEAEQSRQHAANKNRVQAHLNFQR